MRMRLLYASVLAAAAASAAFLAFLSAADDIPEEVLAQYGAVIGLCADGPDSRVRDCVHGALSRYSGVLPPGVALASGIDVVRSRVGADRDCHSVLHSFGEASGAVYGMLSVVPGARACEDGYYHGAVIGMGDLDEAAGGCSVLEAVEDSAGCWHGVGHAFWLSGAGMEGSFSGCMTGVHAFQQTACILGAAMESSMLIGPAAFDLCLFADQVEQLSGCILTVAAHGAIGHGEATFARCVSLPAGLHLASGCRFHVGVGFGTQARGLGTGGDVLSRIPEFCLQDRECSAGVADGLSVIGYGEGFVRSYCIAAGVASCSSAR